jgi:methyl-accepting chemotaxis protein
MLAKAAVEGKLATRADASKHQGDYKKIVDGVNKTLDSVIGPLNVAANYVDRISKGELPPKITDSYNGDFNEIKNNLNTAIDSINALVADAGMLVQAAVEGKLATRADASKHQGDYRKIVEGVNKTLDAVIGPINVTAKYVDDISKGIIPPIITDTYNGDFNIIKNNLNSVVKMMSELLKETDFIIKAAADGELDKRANAELFMGGWKQLVSGVNDTITNIVDPLMVTADYVEKVSKGVIPPEITTVYKGQYNIIKTNLNAVVKMMSELLSETDKLVKAAIAGQLDTRADAGKFLGGWNQLVKGVNETLAEVITPINETVAILKRLAEGDITLRMTGDYKGDFDILKTALNDSLESFNDTLAQVNIAVDQVAEGSLQVSQASQSLSQGATEQASSLEEITSSVTEIASQTKLNTESAGTVNSLANTAKSNAEQGNTQMQNLVQAMGDINKSAEGIKTIVKAIDDISFQINLLALNANVEAARAGKYGKGFAVVAEEVRNLAVRSANSVKDTTRMVDEAIANIERGNELCDLTAKQLADIVGGAGQVATLAEEVATASKEQTQGLEQVSTGLNQIDQVTQANTASSEESASASEELSAQSQQVKSMLARFKLKAKEGKLDNAGMMQMLRAELAKQGGGYRGASIAAAGAAKASSAGARKSKAVAVNPAEVISLDDDNFGKF